MNLPRGISVGALVILAPIGPALAQQASCSVEPVQGAMSAQGAVTRMHIVNTGSACVIVNYGVPLERSDPADSGTIRLG